MLFYQVRPTPQNGIAQKFKSRTLVVSSSLMSRFFTELRARFVFRQISKTLPKHGVKRSGISIYGSWRRAARSTTAAVSFALVLVGARLKKLAKQPLHGTICCTGRRLAPHVVRSRQHDLLNLARVACSGGA